MCLYVHVSERTFSRVKIIHPPIPRSTPRRIDNAEDGYLFTRFALLPPLPPSPFFTIYNNHATAILPFRKIILLDVVRLVDTSSRRWEQIPFDKQR